MPLQPVTTSPTVMQTYIDKRDEEKDVIDQKILRILKIYSKQLEQITRSPTRNNYELNLWVDNYGSVECYAGPCTYLAPKTTEELVKEEPVKKKGKKKFFKLKKRKEESVIKKDTKKLSKIEKKKEENKEKIVRNDEFLEIKEEMARAAIKNDPIERRVVIKFGSETDKKAIVEMDPTIATAMNLIEFAINHFKELNTSNLVHFHSSFEASLKNEIKNSKTNINTMVLKIR